MATLMDFRINYVDADVAYATTPADYILVDLTNDFLIWSDSLEDVMTTDPTIDELNAAATLISDDAAVTVARCLLRDYSHNVGGAYWTHLIDGMGENKQYVFCFDFDGATATEPRLEAWDDDSHTTTDKHVVGAGTALDSMVKAVCTTLSLPGVGWAGTPIAGASNYVLLNDGNGALSGAADLYANIKIVIPIAYAYPAAETFVICVRYTYL